MKIVIYMFFIKYGITEIIVLVYLGIVKYYFKAFDKHETYIYEN